ncbi:MAG: YiiX/YebB-like N1pC/P60 family cysteine hydrolase [Bacteroidales bacterium]
MLRRIIYIILLFLLLVMASMSFSYFFPGKVHVLDKLRLAVQAPLMTNIGNYKYGKVYMHEGEETEGPDDITYWELRPVLAFLNPGNIIVTRTRRYLSSEFIPGKWKHSAIYLGDQKRVQQYFGKDSRICDRLSRYYQTGKEKLIIDSNSEGVRIHEIQDLSNLNQVSLLNAFMGFELALPRNKTETFVLKAMDQVGKQYDFDLRMEDKSAIYCSELLVVALDAVDIHISNSSEAIGRTFISPDNLVTYIQNVGIPDNEFRFMALIEKKDNHLNIVTGNQ